VAEALTRAERDNASQYLRSSRSIAFDDHQGGCRLIDDDCRWVEARDVTGKSPDESALVVRSSEDADAVRIDFEEGTTVEASFVGLMTAIRQSPSSPSKHRESAGRSTRSQTTETFSGHNHSP